MKRSEGLLQNPLSPNHNHSATQRVVGDIEPRISWKHPEQGDADDPLVNSE
jgi:hypothetical protein